MDATNFGVHCRVLVNRCPLIKETKRNRRNKTNSILLFNSMNGFNFSVVYRIMLLKLCHEINTKEHKKTEADDFLR